MALTDRYWHTEKYHLEEEMWPCFEFVAQKQDIDSLKIPKMKLCGEEEDGQNLTHPNVQVMKMTAQNTLMEESPEVLELLDKFSSFTKTVRTLAYFLLFATKKYLNFQEAYAAAEIVLFKTQKLSSKEENGIKSKFLLKTNSDGLAETRNCNYTRTDSSFKNFQDQQENNF